MFPNGMLEKFRTKVSEDVYYETLLYESVLGISMSNYDEAIEYIRQALSHEPCLMSSLERLVRCGIINSYKVSNRLARDFGIPRCSIINIRKVSNRLASDFKIVMKTYKQAVNKCFENDDVDAYIKFSLEHPNNDIKDDITAILWDAVRILKYIICNCADKNDLHRLAKDALECGNYEIIRILEQNGVDFKECLFETLKNMNHYEIIEWLVMKYGEEIRPEIFKQSLINDSKTDHYNIVLTCDLPNILDKEYLEEDRKSVVKDLITYNCLNTISKIDKYLCSDLLYCAVRYQTDIFKVIFSKIDDVMLPCDNDLNILQSTILTSNIEFVKPIVEKNPKILFLMDRFKNNILHFCARQHSKKVFEYIVSRLSSNAFEMIIEKNIFNETPMDLLKRYDLMYFLTDVENPNEYCPIDHPENYKKAHDSELIKLYSNTHARKSFNFVFENIRDSAMFKFVDTRNVTNAAYMFKSLRDSECLKYLDISKFTSFSSLFSRFRGNSIEALRGWDVKNVENMNSVFRSAKFIKDFSPISDWDVSNVSCFSFAFQETALTDLSAFSKWNINKLKDFAYMFAGCESLVDCSGIDSWELSDDHGIITMFNGCNHIKRYPIWYMKALEKINEKKNSKRRH